MTECCWHVGKRFCKLMGHLCESGWDAMMPILPGLIIIVLFPLLVVIGAMMELYDYLFERLD